MVLMAVMVFDGGEMREEGEMCVEEEEREWKISARTEKYCFRFFFF